MNISSTVRCLCLFSALLYLAGCASTNVVSATGSDPWSQRVNEIWLARARLAVTTFDRLLHEQTGLSLQKPPRVVIASSAELARAARASEPDVLVVTLLPTASERVSYDQATRLPVGARLQAVLQELTGGKLEQTPQWLRDGLAAAWEKQVLDALHGEVSGHDVENEETYRMRNSKNLVTPNDLMFAKPGYEKRVGVQQMSGLMTERLQLATGPRFAQAWVAYFREAATPGFDAEAAFTRHFGMTRESFVGQFEVWLTALQAEQRQHARPVPEASGYAELRDATRYPLTSDTAQKARVAYLQARSPKALALSSRGAYSSVFDNSDAMEVALRLCRVSDPVSCQLYAVDDRVVYRPAETDVAKVEVLLASRGDDEWTQQVRTRWLPIVQQAADNYSRLLKQRAGVGLNETVRIQLASNRRDYERMLQEDLKLLSGAAGDATHLTAGMSNLRGQIDISLPSDIGEPAIRERAMKTSLHELTHEVQGQLSRLRAGGVVPRWIMEGTADLFAYNAVKDLPIEGAAELSPQQWRDKCVQWYKQSYNKVSPEDVFTSSGVEWTKFMSYGNGPYQMAGLMAMHLESLLGDGFYPAWVGYFRLIADPKQDEQAAFEKSFGLNRAAFLESFKKSLKSL